MNNMILTQMPTQSTLILYHHHLDVTSSFDCHVDR